MARGPPCDFDRRLSEHGILIIFYHCTFFYLFGADSMYYVWYIIYSFKFWKILSYDNFLVSVYILPAMLSNKIFTGLKKDVCIDNDMISHFPRNCWSKCGPSWGGWCTRLSWASEAHCHTQTILIVMSHNPHITFADKSWTVILTSQGSALVSFYSQFPFNPGSDPVHGSNLFPTLFPIIV